MAETSRYLLTDDQVPTSWYNVIPDLPEPPPPPYVAGRTLALSGSHRFLREYRLPSGLQGTE